MSDIDRDALDRWITSDPRDRNYAACYCGHELDDHGVAVCDFCDCRSFEEYQEEDDFFESDDYGDDDHDYSDDYD